MTPNKKTPYALGAEAAAANRKRLPPARFGMASRHAWVSGWDTEKAYQRAQMEMFHAGEIAPKEKKPAHQGERRRVPRRGEKGAVNDGAGVPALRCTGPATEA